MNDVLRTSTEIMFKKPFYGFFLTTLSKKIIKKSDPLYKEIPTAAVSKNPERIGFVLYINEDHWWTLSRAAQIEMLLHELEHIVYFHPTMSKSFNDKYIFNLAADLQINHDKPALLEASKAMSMEDYTKFMKDNKEAIERGEVVAPCRYISFEDFGFDPNTEKLKGTRWYYNRLMEMQDEKDQSKEAKKLRQLVQAIQEGANCEGSHNSWDKNEQMTEAEAELLDNNTKRTLQRIYESNKTLNHGDIPAHILKFIENVIKKKKAVTNWKAVFRNMVAKAVNYSVKSSRRKLNKRIEEYSSTKMKPKKEIFIGLDTSGSMSENDIKMAFGEIDQIWKSGVGVTVGECDAALDRKNDVYQYEGKYPKARKGLSGGGGTSVRPLIDYVNDMKGRYTAFIYLTDGYMSDPGKKSITPMITVLTPTGADVKEMNDRKEFGRVLKMKVDEFK